MTAPTPLNQRALVVEEALPNVLEAKRRGLMHVTLEARAGKTVTLPGGRRVREFVSSSFLGLDQHPHVIAGGKALLDAWGVHFSAARTGFSIGPNKTLEDALSDFFGGRAVTFASVAATHFAVLPLVASGVLWHHERPTRLVFDSRAHASMASLKGLLRETARVETIEHGELEAHFKDAHAAGERAVFIADSVSPSGARRPLSEWLALAEKYDARLYLDDAHGTSLYGPRGQGSVFETVGPRAHPRIIWAFSLSKGFGTNGGGIVLPNVSEEALVRSFGLTNPEGASLDASAMGAAMASLELHLDGTVAALGKTLRSRVAFFDAQLKTAPAHFSPIRTIGRRSTQHALDSAEQLIERGYFVSALLSPAVPREMPQLQVCVAVDHTEADLAGLANALHEID